MSEQQDEQREEQEEEEEGHQQTSTGSNAGAVRTQQPRPCVDALFAHGTALVSVVACCTCTCVGMHESHACPVLGGLVRCIDLTIRVRATAGSTLTDADLASLRRIAASCPIHTSIAPTTYIHTRFEI